jgi:hypothetical protein
MSGPNFAEPSQLRDYINVIYINGYSPSYVPYMYQYNLLGNTCLINGLKKGAGSIQTNYNSTSGSI